MADDDGDQFDEDDDETYGDYLEEQRRTFPHLQPDGVLEFYVKFVNEFTPELSFGITLVVNGTFLAGDLISMSRFLRDTYARAEEGGEIGVALFSSLRSAADELDLEKAVRDALAAAAEAEAGSTPAAPLFAHLANASAWTPGSPVSEPVGLYRIRLSHVSAWGLGKVANS